MKQAFKTLLLTAALAALPLCLLAAEPCGTEEPATLTVEGGILHGTLLIPKKEQASFPVVLIHPGSGPTDRDGNSTLLPSPNNSLKYLAEGLACSGVASLRIDKRMIGESRIESFTERDLRLKHLVQDTVGWTQQLQEDARFSTVSILGHSLGGLIAILAAQEVHPDGILSLAGIGLPGADVLRRQLRGQLLPSQVSQIEKIFKALESGQDPGAIPPEFHNLVRPDVVPYLISWFRYDPATELAKVNVPALVIQGTTDIQVTVDDARRLAQGKEGVELFLVENMNHVLKEVASTEYQPQIASYSDPDLPVSQILVDRIAAFLTALPPSKAAAN